MTETAPFTKFELHIKDLDVERGGSIRCLLASTYANISYHRVKLSEEVDKKAQRSFERRIRRRVDNSAVFSVPPSCLRVQFASMIFDKDSAYALIEMDMNAAGALMLSEFLRRGKYKYALSGGGVSINRFAA